MTELDLQTSVGQWVAKVPRTSRVFEAQQIDYCCGGNKSLALACRDRQLDPQEILNQLRGTANTVVGEATQDWTTAPLAQLCDHIVATHHAYLKTELPRLTELIAKVVNAHGDKDPNLARLRQVFADLRNELEPHMLKEERILFPAIRQLEQASARPSFPFGTVANPIRMMEHEHDIAGHALTLIRELTRDFEVPADACNTYRALLDALREFQADLHQHIHKENNILFPRAQALEK